MPRHQNYIYVLLSAHPLQYATSAWMTTLMMGEKSFDIRQYTNNRRWPYLPKPVTVILPLCNSTDTLEDLLELNFTTSSHSSEACDSPENLSILGR